jgi:hypothetical protein
MREEYHLLDSRMHSLVIKKGDWERSVFPGRGISMSAVMSALSGKVGTCPRPACLGRSARIAGQPTILWSV